MQIKIMLTLSPGKPETVFSVRGSTLTVDGFSFTFPDGDDGEDADISKDSEGKILQAYRKDGVNYAVIHYLAPSTSIPYPINEFFEVSNVGD